MFAFPGQRENENVLEVITKHSIVYWKIFTAFLIIVVFPLTALLLIWFAVYPLDLYYEQGMMVGLFCCVYFLYGLLFACIRWINEEFDVFIVTADRLIDITQVSFFKRSVASASLEQIQDTTGVVHGLMATLLHYGDLNVKTAAGNASEFFIDCIPNPEEVARRILDLANKKRNHLAALSRGAPGGINHS